MISGAHMVFGDDPDLDPPQTARPSRLDLLREAVAEQARLNSRIIRVSLPEQSVIELHMRLPLDQGEVAEVAEAARRQIAAKPGRQLTVAEEFRLRTLVARGVLARFTVAIHYAGEPLVDCTGTKEAAFADEELREVWGAKGSVDAVAQLFGNDQLVTAYYDAFSAATQPDADAQDVVEDPTGRG